jgi:ParB/RepB/Spo0J family partition protein
MSAALALDRIHQLKIGDVEPDPLQPRETFLAKPLEELAANIRERGIKQPITVRRSADAKSKKFIIVTGERRWRAAKLAGLKVVPCILVDAENPADVIVDQLSENNLREGLNDLELAGALQQLREAGKGPAEIVKHLETHGIKMSRSAVSNTLRLLELPEWAKKLVRDGKIGGAHARQILRAVGYPNWLELVRKRINEDAGAELTVLDVDDAVSGALNDNRVARHLYEHGTAFNWREICAECPHFLKIKTSWHTSHYCLAPEEYARKQAEGEAKAAARAEKKATTPAETATEPADVKPRKLKISSDGLITLGSRVGTYRTDEFRPLEAASFDTAVCAECPHKRTGTRTGKKDEDAREVCSFPEHFDRLQRAGDREASRREKFKEALDALLLPELQRIVANPLHHRVQAAIVAYVGVGQPLERTKPRGEFSYVSSHQLRDGSSLDQDGARVIWNLGVALEAYRDHSAGEDPTRELARLALPLLHYEQRRELARFLGVKLADFYKPTEAIAKLFRKDELVRVIDPHHEKTGWKPSLPSRPVGDLQAMFVDGGQPIPPSLLALWDSAIGNIDERQTGFDFDDTDSRHCRYCDCSEFEPCELEDGPCAWRVISSGDLPDDEGVCSNPECLAKFAAEFPESEAAAVAA